MRACRQSEHMVAVAYNYRDAAEDRLEDTLNELNAKARNINSKVLF